MSTARKIWSAVIIAVTLVTALLVGLHLRTYLNADYEVVAARDAQRGLYELAIVLQDAENGARGYALTSLPRHKAIFERAVVEVDARLTTAQNAVQGIDRLRDFGPIKNAILQRADLLRQMVTVTATGNTAEASRILQSDSADLIGLTVRQEMEGLVEFANSRLEQRLAICRKSMMSMTWWVVFGLAALLFSGAAMVWDMVGDIRSQRRISAELRRARDGALAGAQARDDFLNVLSHELRTPLTPALLMVSGMEKRESPGSDTRKDLAMVRRQLELEARLIDDLLDVSRILRGDVVLRSEKVSLHPLIRQLCKVLSEALEDSALTLTCTLDATNDLVQGSESRLHQVFWHLLSNAIKFTPENGTVTVTTTNANGRIAITVTDTGLGMTAQQLPTIFEAFATSQSSRTRMFGGLGVGLAIVKSVIEMHQGSVTVNSEGKDKGASFRVELPVIPAV